jgi:hypothetical protein
MFEYDELATLDGTAAAGLVAESHRLLVRQESRLLQLAAHWADLHSWEEDLDATGPVRGPQRARQLGGVGTPWVLEFAAAELGALQQTTTAAAFAMMADALDLRHRLPRLWSRVLAGQVRGWKARKVAQATRHLNEEAAARVDAAVAGLVGLVAWGRFLHILDGEIISADPAAAEQRAALWEAQRFVRSGRSQAGGLKLLVARASAGDVIWFMAMVDRIAEILQLEGDADSADVRRSKAIGILAQPAVALRMLVDHQHDTSSSDLSEPAALADATGQVPEIEPSDHRSVQMSTRPGLGTIDPARLRPPATLYVHVSQESVTRDAGGVARFEGVGPVTREQVRRFLGDHCSVRIQPVIDVANTPAVDGYEVPHRLREALQLRHPTEVFPYGTRSSRHADLDHTVPYLTPEKGGPPGQTGLDNLGPLSRHHHRLKTHGRWRLRQPGPGTYLWRSPHGHVFLVTAGGTQHLGSSDFAHRTWRTAGQSRARPNAPARAGQRATTEAA